MNQPMQTAWRTMIDDLLEMPYCQEVTKNAAKDR